MAPVALAPPIEPVLPTVGVGTPKSTKYKSDSKTPTPTHTPISNTTSASTDLIPAGILDIPRRPSPWTDLAHSLSTTSLPHSSHRRSSSASLNRQTPSTSTSLSTSTSTSTTTSTPDNASPVLSSSALREWEARLSNPSTSFSRHTLVPPPHSPHSPHLASSSSSPSAFASSSASGYACTPSPTLVPKLVPERDKEGHIEYKLKLIDPTPERFERLVTQMMWRLKQGGNEAIYELGLADDGTVIGLTRAEMDSSLRTLELMASEVGATVLVLKEIVLARNPIPGIHSFSSSISTSASTGGSSPGTGWVPRPQTHLDRISSWEKEKVKENHHQGAVVKKKRSGRTGMRRRDRVRNDWVREGMRQEPNKERQIVFDPNDMGAESEEEDGGPEDEESKSDGVENADGERSDDDVPPFTLDLEDAPRSQRTHLQPDPSDLVTQVTTQISDHSPTHLTWARPSSRPKVSPSPSSSVSGSAYGGQVERSRKAANKARKSMERTRKRRLDLLRGDGKSPSPFDFPAGDSSADLTNSTATPLPTVSRPRLPLLPHQPARPSSLRLASPAPLTNSSSSPENDPLLVDLLHLPLDSLSLSFADVRTVTAGSSPNSSSTEYAEAAAGDHEGVDDWLDTPSDGDCDHQVTRDDRQHELERDEGGEELICVEALVVRKMGMEEEEGWSFGGEEDGWGFGGNDSD